MLPACARIDRHHKTPRSAMSPRHPCKVSPSTPPLLSRSPCLAHCSAIPARLARSPVSHLLTETMEQGSDIGLGCLAHAMAKVTGHVAELESGEIVRGLKHARWSLAEASENAG